MQKRALALAVGTALGAAGAGVQASGFQIMTQSASGIGVAFAGMAAAGQDASTAFWNPAAMSLLPGVQGAAVLSYVAPHTEYKDDGTSSLNRLYPLEVLGNGGSDGAPNAWVPALYATWMLTPDWSVGLAVNAPFGLTTEWDSPWAGQFFAVKSKIETLNINPVVSFRVNDMVTLGAGFSYQQLKAELTNAVPMPGLSPARAPLGKVDGEDWGVGWNVGALIDFQQGTRLGLTYRSTIDYTLEDGKLTVGGANPLPGGITNSVIADVELPDTFSIGLSHQFTPETRVLADWTWTGWDSIQDLTIRQATFGTAIKTTPLNFDNSWRAGLGVEHQLNPSWLLRAGVAYDNTPVQDEYRTPRLPDEDRTWFAVGVRYQPEQNAAWWIDVGYAHEWVDDATSELNECIAVVDNRCAARATLNGNYESDINLFAAQVSFRF
jgi:long-chain fatty acid transport protein